MSRAPAPALPKPYPEPQPQPQPYPKHPTLSTYPEQVEAERARLAEAAKAQLAEPPKRPPSSSLAPGYAPTGNEYRDRKARAAGGRGSAARRVQTPTAARTRRSF